MNTAVVNGWMRPGERCEVSVLQLSLLIFLGSMGSDIFPSVIAGRVCCRN